MKKSTRRAKTTLVSEGLVGVIVKYELSEKRWELLGSFEGNNVYKLKEKKEWESGTTTN